MQFPPNILVFSFYGGDASTFSEVTVSSVFERCIKNFEVLISKLDRKKTDVSARCIIFKTTLDKYENIFYYLKKWHMLSNAQLVPVFDFQKQAKKENAVMPDSSEKENILKKISDVIKRCTDSDKKIFLMKWKKAVNEVKPRSEPHHDYDYYCVVPWFSTYITATGNVLPCCYLSNEEYIMGNIFESSFIDIWNGGRYKEFRKQLRDHRTKLPWCNTCGRNDLNILRRYGMLAFGKSKWHI